MRVLLRQEPAVCGQVHVGAHVVAVRASARPLLQPPWAHTLRLQGTIIFMMGTFECKGAFAVDAPRCDTPIVQHYPPLAAWQRVSMGGLTLPSAT